MKITFEDSKKTFSIRPLHFALFLLAVIIFAFFQNFSSTGVTYPVLAVEAQYAAKAIAPNKVPLVLADLGYPPGDIRRYGAKSYSCVALTTAACAGGNDATSIIDNALSLGIPTYVPPGYWGITNITTPSEQILYGAGIHASYLVSLGTDNSTILLTDRGSAEKVDIHDLTFFTNNTPYTQGIYLGHYGVPFGTEGLIDNVWVDNGASVGGFPGMNINGNVGHFGRLLVQNTAGIAITGSGNMIDKIESFGSGGIKNLEGVVTAANFGDTQINAIEIEAPRAAVPLFFEGNVNIGSVWISFGDHATCSTCPATFDHLVQIGPNSSVWNISNLVFYYSQLVKVKGGAIKTVTAYKGLPNASGAVPSAHYASGPVTY